MSGLIEWLEKLNQSDSKARAVLRRSLAFEPGQHVPAFPYVEPFLRGDVSRWRRDIHYLVAGVWAMHWREGREEEALSIGKACARLDREKRDSMGMDDKHKLTSTEKRLIALLDADEDQLPYRLRQMVALLKEYTIDFEHMLTDLLNWRDQQKRTQNKWARDFYQHLNHEPELDKTSQKESAA
ncbi:type I-E CRISPR-associated protein Cse2/CasB [Nitrincola iocasae]|uniref:Type I-E CRISPR-associated protein Cse2/CasB n=1 Tax=Nitrincola iocasae TaxID=2614693 RepID=A0A5J6L9X6_9GAMM|nr:type I-E CRISPR-associated protein Cse2/CasB [Nitrincola iocasae]QEW05307.1 type I-E CRISPR-associated protein Cse2/CasB [Nitrincola iocasae]